MPRQALPSLRSVRGRRAHSRTAARAEWRRCRRFASTSARDPAAAHAVLPDARAAHAVYPHAQQSLRLLPRERPVDHRLEQQRALARDIGGGA